MARTLPMAPPKDLKATCGYRPTDEAPPCEGRVVAIVSLGLTRYVCRACQYEHARQEVR